MTLEIPDERSVRRVLERARDLASDPAGDLGDLDSWRLVPQLDPEEVWLVLGLVRHEHRQAWVADIVRERLRGNPEKLGAIGAFGHPDRRSGVVPGLPEWEFYFHGKGCCLTHRVDGTTIDVDFPGGDHTPIDPFFYGQYLESLREPEFVERQLILPEPLDEAWHHDLDGLAGFMLLCGNRVQDAARDLAAALDPLVARLAELDAEARRDDGSLEAAALCAALGDWKLARGLGGGRDESIRAGLDHRAREHAAKRADAARSRGSRDLLASLGREFAEDILVDALRGSADMLALEVLPTWCDPGVDEEVMACLERMSQPGQCDSFRVDVCVTALLRSRPAQSVPAAMRARLLAVLVRIDDDARANGRANGRIGLMIACLDPGDGVARLARGLHHEDIDSRAEVAAALATVQTDAALEALLGGLGRAGDWRGYEETIAIREALRAFGGGRGRDAAHAYEVVHERPPLPQGELVEMWGKEHRVYPGDDLDRIHAVENARHTITGMREEFGRIVEGWVGPRA